MSRMIIAKKKKGENEDRNPAKKKSAGNSRRGQYYKKGEGAKPSENLLEDVKNQVKRGI